MATRRSRRHNPQLSRTPCSCRWRTNRTSDKQYSTLIALKVAFEPLHLPFVTYHTHPLHTFLSTRLLPPCRQSHHEKPSIPLTAKERVAGEATTTPNSRPVLHQSLTGMSSANRYPIPPLSSSAT